MTFEIYVIIIITAFPFITECLRNKTSAEGLKIKEIGILRAIGASKHNISQVFNAETLIIGLCSGILGVGISELLLIPINAIIHVLVGSATVNAVLSLPAALILIAISTIITLIGGLLPAKKAAKKDPVIALRTE